MSDDEAVYFAKYSLRLIRNSHQYLALRCPEGFFSMAAEENASSLQDISVTDTELP